MFAPVNICLTFPAVAVPVTASATAASRSTAVLRVIVTVMTSLLWDLVDVRRTGTRTIPYAPPRTIVRSTSSRSVEPTDVGDALGDVLLADEPRHNLPLGLLATARAQPEVYPERRRLGRP